MYWAGKKKNKGRKKDLWMTDKLGNLKRGERMKNPPGLGTALQATDFFLKRWSVSLWGERAETRIQEIKCFS